MTASKGNNNEIIKLITKNKTNLTLKYSNDRLGKYNC